MDSSKSLKKMLIRWLYMSCFTCLALTTASTLPALWMGQAVWKKTTGRLIYTLSHMRRVICISPYMHTEETTSISWSKISQQAASPPVPCLPEKAASAGADWEGEQVRVDQCNEHLAKTFSTCAKKNQNYIIIAPFFLSQVQTSGRSLLWPWPWRRVGLLQGQSLQNEKLWKAIKLKLHFTS